ncbi:MAG: hypothetical protein IPP29_18195 [Bacteroidetes bacterium]|nr:hypothetical protein [Bacteroidota bacterium]
MILCTYNNISFGTATTFNLTSTSPQKIGTCEMFDITFVEDNGQALTNAKIKLVLSDYLTNCSTTTNHAEFILLTGGCCTQAYTNLGFFDEINLNFNPGCTSFKIRVVVDCSVAPDPGLSVNPKIKFTITSTGADVFTINQGLNNYLELTLNNIVKIGIVNNAFQTPVNITYAPVLNGNPQQYIIFPYQNLTNASANIEIEFAANVNSSSTYCNQINIDGNNMNIVQMAE